MTCSWSLFTFFMGKRFVLHT